MLHSRPGRTGGGLAGRHRIRLIRRERGYSEPGDTASGRVRRLILRQRLAEPDARGCALVASDGMGGTVLSGNEGAWAVVVPGYGMGGTVPPEDEGEAVVPGSGSGAAGSDMCLPFPSGARTTPPVTPGS